MATMNASSSAAIAGVNMARFWPGTSGGTILEVVTNSTTQYRITIDLGGGTTYDIVYIGSGFTYDANDIATGGNYTSIQLRATGGTTAIASLSSLTAQPLADIYALSLANLTPLSGNDTITGSSNAASNDVLYGGAGNDTISDTGGSIFIDAGADDDKISIGTVTLGRTGTIIGGSGTDILHLSKDISGVALSGVEILEATGGITVIGKAAQFGSFDTIRVAALLPTSAVGLQFMATGTATTTDLSGALNSGGGPRRGNVTGSTDNETIITGDAIDFVYGGDGNDVITGGLGNDNLNGQNGNDTLNGGDGNDVLNGGSGNNTYNGGVGDDLFVSDGGSNKIETMNGGDGVDLFLVQAGAGVTTGAINGGNDNDTIEFRRSFSGTINGGQGIDTVKAFSQDLSGVTNISFEHFEGSALAKLAFFTAFQTVNGNVSLAASGFNVVFDFTTLGVSSVFGSSDNETLTAAARVSGGGGNDILRGNTELLGGDGNDTLHAGAGQDYLDGGTGNDILNGNGENDHLVDFSGSDTLNGGDGNDRLEANANDTLNGGNGNDTILVSGGGLVTISGGEGTDLVVIRDGTFTGSINGGNGTFDTLRVNEPTLGLPEDPSDNISGIAISNVEELQVATRVVAKAAQFEAFEQIRHFQNTGQLMLVLAASGFATHIDLIDETIFSANVSGLNLIGSADNETMVSTGFNDTLAGGLGINTVSYARAIQGVTVNLSTTAVQDTGGGGLDRLSGFSNLIGSGVADTLTGNSGNNVLDGGAGNDRMVGGAGNDLINGGAGVDVLTGAVGLDTFVFNTASPSVNRDVITDFVAADDTIRLENAIFTALGAATGTLAAAKFKANATGTATDADDRIVYNTTTGALIYDINGNGAGGAFQFATLSSKPTITAADFFVV